MLRRCQFVAVLTAADRRLEKLVCPNDLPDAVPVAPYRGLGDMGIRVVVPIGATPNELVDISATTSALAGCDVERRASAIAAAAPKIKVRFIVCTP
jgi:hypothetical protein